MLKNSLIYKQLASLLKSGIPLNRAIKILAAQSSDKLKGSLEDVSSQLENGISFSESMYSQKLISRSAKNAIFIAESNAFLEDALARMAILLDKKAGIDKKLKKALTYPAIVLALSMISFAGMVFFVLPSFSGIYSGTAFNLPLVTRIALAIPSFSKIILVVFLVLALLTVYAIKDADLRVKLPLIGHALKDSVVSDFCFALSYQLKGGVPLISALQNVKESIESKNLKSQIDSAMESIRNGNTFTKAFSGGSYFNDIFLQLSAVGEENGRLWEMLWQAGEYYADDAETLLEKTVALIEPAATLCVGGVVAFVALSMIMPLFSMVNSLL